MSSLSKLVESIVFSIVDDTENVLIEEEEAGGGILFRITVSKEDTGKLIGKKGRVAEALRTVTKAAGAKQGVRVLVNVMKEPLE